MRRLLDRLLAGLVRTILHVFFRGVEVVGAERVPRGLPLLIVANHINSLIDPLLVMGFVPAHPRFLAKSTLWQNPALRPFLQLGAVVPVHRRMDVGADTSKNVDMFARCFDELGRGGAIAMFPEGLSHSEPALMPLKTGAARIVLGTCKEHPQVDVRVIPVGLTFDQKDQFRSRALVLIGESIDPAPERILYAEDDVGAVRGLTERIGEGIKQVTLNYASWEDAARVERAIELFYRTETDVPATLPLAQRVVLGQAFTAGYRELLQSVPDRVTAVTRAMQEYDRLLAVVGLRDEQVASRYPLRAAAWYTFRTFVVLLLAAPFALVGTVLNWLPYRVPGWVAARVAKEPDHRATYKVLVGILAFPAVWMMEALLVLALAGAAAGAAMLVVAPATGYIALRFTERARRFRTEARAFLLLKKHPQLGEKLTDQRRALCEEVRALVELHRAG